MPMPIQRDIKEIEAILNEVLNTRCPPVGRCRLLSSGFGTSHALNITENISGHKECLGCGNCVDICPFLSREPSRRDKTVQRTSMALESIVGEDCDLCDACILVCPQVDTTIKNYVVNYRMIEVMAGIESRIGDEDEPDLDLYLEEALE
ncbi:MAG TPA: 4Fe-4S dicluster domain-containing protein [Dehalococcoidales bacterium]|nr:4Fe-4S dicluster domain-containing protein [Dehalococcoidales bacterium]